MILLTVHDNHQAAKRSDDAHLSMLRATASRTAVPARQAELAHSGWDPQRHPLHHQHRLLPCCSSSSQWVPTPAVQGHALPAACGSLQALPLTAPPALWLQPPPLTASVDDRGENMRSSKLACPLVMQLPKKRNTLAAMVQHIQHVHKQQLPSVT